MSAARPRRVKVGPVTYSIDWSQELPGKYGESDNLGCAIRISRNCAEPQRRLTLWHEILHATIAVYGGHLGYTERAARSSASAAEQLDTEELYVRALELGLMQVMRDNPALLRWCLE